MIPKTKSFDSFLEIFKQVPLLPQVFIRERMLEIVTWKDNRNIGEILALSEGEQNILHKSGFEIILENEPEMSRLLYEEIEHNIIADLSDGQLKRYLALLNEKVSYRLQCLEQYNHIDILYDSAFSHVSPRLFFDYINALRTTYSVFQSLEEYLIAKQQEYGFLKPVIKSSEQGLFEANTQKGSLNLKSQFLNPNEYDLVIEKLTNSKRIKIENGKLIFKPFRSNAKYEAIELCLALESSGYIKGLSESLMIIVLANTFHKFVITDRTARSSKIGKNISHYKAIVS